MKKLAILLFSILIPFSSYGKWMEILKLNNVTYHIDVDTYKKHNENVYWWEMLSFSKPIGSSNWRSATFYKQGECGIHRYKVLALNTYTKPMAKGDKESESRDVPSKWHYPEPLNINSLGLEAACKHAK